MKFQQLSLNTCLNTCTFKLIFLHLRFYPKEEDLRNDGVCYPPLYVEKNAVPASRKRVHCNIIYDQSILQRCILLVWRWRFSILMDGVLNGSIWQRIFVFSSLLITIYVKIKNIFHFSSVDSMFNIFEIKFILMHYLLTNEDDEQILSG